MIQLMITILILVCGTRIESHYKSVILKIIEEDELVAFQKVLSDFDVDLFMERRLQKVNRILINIIWIPLFRNRIRISLILFVASLFVYKLPYYRLKREVEKMREEIKMSFPLWIRQLQILLQSNTVAISLMKSLDRAPKLIKKELEELILLLNSEPTCYKYYAEFLNQYDLVQISRAMKCLYRCAVEGKKGSYKGLEQLSLSTSLWIRQKRNQRKEMRLMLYQWWGMLPLFGVTIVFLVIMANVITNLMGKEVIG